MGATVHGGALSRWFEELCRIRHQTLKELAVEGNHRLRAGALPSQGGVYAFWWTGDRALLSSSRCNRMLELPGPGGRAVPLKLDDEWLGLPTNLPVPLYVGKNSSGIANRVGQHLRLNDIRMLPLGGGARKAPRPTTSCQLRAGVEHLFPHEQDTRALVLGNVGLSYVVLHGDDNAANRFYLEELAVGLMRPPFNVDIER